MENSLLEIILPNITKEAHFLDLGCGSGEDSLFMVNNGFQVTAVDQLPELIKKLQQKIKDNNLANIEVSKEQSLTRDLITRVYQMLELDYNRK